MEEKHKYTTLFVSRDKVYVKAITILLNLFYKTNAYCIDSLNEQNLSGLNNINPDFVIIDCGVCTIKMSDLETICYKYPRALFCALTIDKNAIIPFKESFHHTIYQQLFIQNFRETINIYHDHCKNIQNRSKEEVKNQLNTESQYSQLYSRLFKKSKQEIAIQLA